MERLECKRCGKVIEGYSKNHVEYLMRQHELKHIRESRENLQKLKGGKE